MGLLSLFKKALPQLRPVDTRGGWFPIIREAMTGDWQRNIENNVDTVLSYSAVYACISRISSDIGKLRVKLVEQDADGIWSETDNPAFSPVLRKQNRYQTRNQFFEHWLTTKLIQGNTYVLKQRDNRNVVTALYILDSLRVTPLIAPDGSVFYQLKRDDLSQVTDDIIAVPASEIIHDRINALFHPLVGVSPIYASGLAAMQGVSIQNNSNVFFQNAARPSGILTAPGEISQDTAERIKASWEEKFSGQNYGRTAVLGDGLHFESMMLSAEASQLIEQLKWTAENVCMAFGVPPFMIGIGDLPTADIDKLMNIYYAETLQRHIEEIETLLDEGLGLQKPFGTEFDTENLMRMDTASLYDTIGKGIGAGLLAPNEGRQKIDLPPVAGGDSPYLQEQNWPLSILAARPTPVRPPTPPADTTPPASAKSVPQVNAEFVSDYAGTLLARRLNEQNLSIVQHKQAA